MQTAIEATFPWLSVLILLAAGGSLGLALIKPAGRFAKQITLGISLLILALYAVALLMDFAPQEAGVVQLSETYTWISQLGVSLAWGVNGFSAVMIGLAVFLVPLVIIAAWNDFTPEKAAGYFAWILFLEAVMIALFAARDVFLFYILFELMILPMYFLIGRYGGQGRKRAAMKFLLYSLLGGFIMLVGVIAVYFYGPGGPRGYMLDTLHAGLAIPPAAEMWIFFAFFFAFAIKAPMWPVHTWLPDTAASAPTGTSILLVGVLDKLGTYGMIAICLQLFPVASRKAALIIIAFAIVSIIWGALMAISSDNLLRLVSYTSVSHFGFMVMGIFSGSAMALSGAMLYMVAHGVGTAALFFTVDFLAKRGGSPAISAYGGWQRVTPLLAGTFLIAGLATMALPGLSGFIPEYLVLMGTFHVLPVAAILAVIGVVLAALYILLPYQRIFTGPRPELEKEDLRGREKAVLGILIAAMLGLGFYPAPILDLVNPITAQQQVVTVASTSTAALEGSNK